MAIEYIVKSGDTLTRIASKFGFKLYTDIYNHPSNAEFRKKRPNPNLIYPGDRVQIPTKDLDDLVLARPPLVKQAEIMNCWAAAMESWLTVSPREPFSQERLKEMFSFFTDAVTGGLTPAGWGAIATRFQMTARLFSTSPLAGESPEGFKAELLRGILEKSGFIVIVYNHAGNGAVSHVNVVYGIVFEGDTTYLWVMDPFDSPFGGYQKRPLSFYKDRMPVGILWAP
ncbi:LysM peptidoglycan-binding domain-containing protein [Microvirga massiliensis]|uniref:LysM peptidoglycan-binding domain-containing protein n=1 Tax=Microvirga massiliensis TaxID=1033741 RepID=UPI00062B35AA|nr:LysM domain-containing protein [Microvirga massiliensis]